MTRKFFVTEITIQILSEDEPWDGNTGDLEYDLTDGAYVGKILKRESTEVNGQEMASSLYDFGSQPEFFSLNDDGLEIDLEDDEEEVE